MEPVTIHSSQVKGFVNIHADSLDFDGTIIDNPDSAYGTVKSTYCSLSSSIVMSPTAAS